MIRTPIYTRDGKGNEVLLTHFTWDGETLGMAPDVPWLHYMLERGYLAQDREGNIHGFSPHKKPEEWLRYLSTYLHGLMLWAGDPVTDT